jgi:hypothetical protein
MIMTRYRKWQMHISSEETATGLLRNRDWKVVERITGDLYADEGMKSL